MSNPEAADRLPDDPRLARYARQMLFAPLGPTGQRHLRHARVVLVGCGALGSVSADTLVRAGVGSLRIVDRDYIELNNLQRQVLYDEQDIAANLPKAEAAARKLRKINSAVEVEGLVADVNHTNIETLCADADLLLDGCDNFETRFLLNDLAVKQRTPWVYGACIAAEGLVMPILPGQTPCLRCLWDQAPPPGTTPTCDTAGVLAPVAHIVASLQCVAALQILSGNPEALQRALVTVDVWTGRWRSLDMQAAHAEGDCRCCKHGEFDYLAGRFAAAGTTLCGRNAVQLLPTAGVRVDLKDVASRLAARLRPTLNGFMLRFSPDGYEVTLFPDGRAIIKGTADPTVARSVYAKYVGT